MTIPPNTPLVPENTEIFKATTNLCHWKCQLLSALYAVSLTSLPSYSTAVLSFPENHNLWFMMNKDRWKGGLHHLAIKPRCDEDTVAKGGKTRRRENGASIGKPTSSNIINVIFDSGQSTAESRPNNPFQTVILPPVPAQIHHYLLE
jgi:hypothetical protein